MPFGARNEDGWRLCHRRGRTCKQVQGKMVPDMQIIFPSQAKAKSCADELNEKFWPTKGGKPDYVKMDEDGNNWDWDIFWEMLQIIVNHKGLSKEKYDSIVDIAMSSE